MTEPIMRPKDKEPPREKDDAFSYVLFRDMYYRQRKRASLLRSEGNFVFTYGMTATGVVLAVLVNAGKPGDANTVALTVTLTEGILFTIGMLGVLAGTFLASTTLLPRVTLEPPSPRQHDAAMRSLMRTEPVSWEEKYKKNAATQYCWAADYWLKWNESVEGRLEFSKSTAIAGSVLALLALVFYLEPRIGFW